MILPLDWFFSFVTLFRRLGRTRIVRSPCAQMPRSFRSFSALPETTSQGYATWMEIKAEEAPEGT